MHQARHDHEPSRRSFVAAGAAAAGAFFLGGNMSTAQEQPQGPVITRGHINQSVCRWCFNSMSLEQLAQVARQIGLKGIDLVNPEDFPTLKKYDLVATMVNTHGIANGLNNPRYHEDCLTRIRRSIEAAADAGFPNVITLSGNRAGMPDDEGLKNCVVALKQVIGLAEQKKVTICMELLNSKLNHKDYMCDRTEWGVELVKAVGSERFKLLYDIYHMQVQEGDVIATIRKYKDYIHHYHTAGVPGRNELDENQELYYPAIMRAIADTGFTGYVAHEFIPRPGNDPVASLMQAARVCDV